MVLLLLSIISILSIVGLIILIYSCLFTAVVFFMSNLKIESCVYLLRFHFNPRTAKLFQLTFAARGGGLLQPPWILVFPTEFLREIFHGYSFGVKESKGDS